MNNSSPIGSVDKALSALDALANAGAIGAQLAELAAAIGVHKATLHRTLAALRHRGYVEQTWGGAYRLGPAALMLGRTFLAEENLPSLLRPCLERICVEVGELVHLGALAGRDIVYLDKVEPQRAVRVWSAIGLRRPAATTALGRAWLAALPLDDGEIEWFAGNGVDSGTLRQAINAAQSQGYGEENEENEPGICCVAVALLREGRPVAAVSITAPAERNTEAARAERLTTLRHLLPTLLPPGLTIPAALPESREPR